MIYDLLAPVYDRLNGDIDYVAWADFIEDAFSRYGHGKKPELVLDLGCGTGRMTIELAKRGYDMTGVDYSVEMLDRARDCAAIAGLDGKILWLCQDMTEFELYGTVDATVCCLDCINHLTERAALKACLSLVHNYLIPDGIFIFDINGKGKFERVYADNSYVYEEDGSVCIWQNYYNPKNHLCDFYITVFTEDEDGKYEREDEVQTERMYTVRMIKNALSECGFEFLGAFSDFTFGNATDGDERIYFIARCKKEIK